MKKIYLGLALLLTTASFALAKVNVSAGIAYEGNKTGLITTLGNLDVQYFLPILNFNNKVLVIAGAGGKVQVGVGSLKNDENNNTKFIPFSVVAYVEPQVKYFINNDLAFNTGLKGGLGFELFHYLSTEKVNRNKTVATFIMPTSLILGVDYKNLTINIEPTMKFITSKDSNNKLYTQTGDGKFVFGVGLNLGYSFDVDNIK